jgi:PIN domain nuclease of toxin-antitoxin system
LIDSQVLIWILVDHPRLKPPIRELVTSADVVRVSAASIWEISIKRAQSRLSVPDDFLDRVRTSAIEPLAVTMEHGWLAGGLPMFHADPFDRLIVAQAISEGLTIVTSDRRIREYGVPVIAA